MSELNTVPHIPVSQKPFCNEYLDKLDDKSMFWGRLQSSAGRPRKGELFRINMSVSLIYKNATLDKHYMTMSTHSTTSYMSILYAKMMRNFGDVGTGSSQEV